MKRAILAMGLCVAAMAAAGGVDPAVYGPTEPPAFRSALVGPGWDEQFAKAVKEFGDIEAAANPALPVSGVRITGVAKDSQASKLGITRGQTIVSLDGQSVTAETFNDLRTDLPQEMVVVTGDGKSREVTIQPGVLGIGDITLVWPQRVYARGKARDKRWDAFAYVGAAASMYNADLAETAWQRAIAAGYKEDALSDYCGAQIAWRQGRNEEAVAFCARLCGRSNVPAALGVERLARQLALANFKIEQGLARKMAAPPLVPMVSGDEGDFLGKLLVMHQQLPERMRVAASPMQIFGRGEKSFLRKVALVPTGDKGFDQFGRQELGTFRKGKLAQWDAPLDRFYNLVARPTEDDPDAELVIKGKIRDHGPHVGDYLKTFMVHLIDCDARKEAADEEANPNLLQVTLQPSGECDIYMGHDPGVLVQTAEVRGEVMENKAFTLRVLHAGGREEMWINNRRLLYLPAMTSPKRIGFSIELSGVNAEFRADFVVPEAGEK